MQPNQSNIYLREMTPLDIPVGMQLKSLANWNQTEADWRFLLETGAQGGCMVAMFEGKEVGTSTTLSYQNRFSWIGMVLVHPDNRGIGIGKTLLQSAIAKAQWWGTVRLDATPQGQKLYETLGFRVERELVRWECKVVSDLLPAYPECFPITPEALLSIIQFDAPIFGAERGKVLTYLYQQAPQYAFYTSKKGKITGYCLGRPGTHFDQIGPVVANDPQTAASLFRNALARGHSKPIIVDAFTEQANWTELLEPAGFQPQRPLIRMHLGTLNHPGNPDCQYAIAGPELG